MEDLAARTRLARATLEALETDDFAALSETVYVRGYYRKCSKALGLSEAELLQRYEMAGGPRQSPPPTKLLLAGGGGSGEEISRGSRGSSNSWLWLIALVIGVVLAVFALWRVRGSLSKAGAAPAPGAVVLPAPPPGAGPAEAPSPAPSGSLAPANATPGAAAPVTVPQSSTSSNQGAASAAGLTPSAGVAPAEDHASAAANAAPAPTPAPADGDLALTFTGSSWVQVKDSTGKMLLNGMVEAGDTQVVSGHPPYAIELGNAPAVQVHFHGGLVDFKSQIRKNQTAHLQVPAS